MSDRAIYVALTVFMLAANSVTPAFAQSPPPYGAPLTLEGAKQVATAATARMRQGGFDMTIAIVDSGSNLVYFERSNQTGIGTIDAALGKNDQINLLAIPGAFPIDGGVPLVADGQIIGAIGVSGGMPADDGAIANAGAQGLEPPHPHSLHYPDLTQIGHRSPGEPS